MVIAQHIGIILRILKIGLRRDTPSFYRFLRWMNANPWSYLSSLYTTMMLLSI